MWKRDAMWKRVAITLLLLASWSTAVAECDPNDPVTGLPDLSYSVVDWGAAAGGPATLLVVPDGSGAPFTQARRPDGAPVDATIVLTVADPCGPVPNFARNDMWLETVGGGFVACTGGTTADISTDVNGATHWSLPLRAGGHSQGLCLVVINGAPVAGGAANELRFNSPDLNGDLAVSLSDVALFAAAYFGPYAFAADLQSDGALNLADIAVLARSVGVVCP